MDKVLTAKDFKERSDQANIRLKGLKLEEDIQTILESCSVACEDGCYQILHYVRPYQKLTNRLKELGFTIGTPENLEHMAYIIRWD